MARVDDSLFTSRTKWIEAAAKAFQEERERNVGGAVAKGGETTGVRAQSIVVISLILLNLQS